MKRSHLLFVIFMASIIHSLVNQNKDNVLLHRIDNSILLIGFFIVRQIEYNQKDE